MHTSLTDRLIHLALEEDLGTGDLTTRATVSPEAQCRAVVVAKSPCVIAGTAYFSRVFELLGAPVQVSCELEDGDHAGSGETVIRLSGPVEPILSGERTALNILQSLCGIATLTRRFVDAIEGTDARIVDTRKTPPGMRTMAKQAVLAGGGSNHRMGLDSGILIKENHIASAGSVTRAVQLARSGAPHSLRVEVEVTNATEVGQALEAGADILLLDNMSLEAMGDAVARARAGSDSVLLEASGNLTLERVRSVAEVGVDLLSVGALTHSAPAADLSLRIVES